VKKIAIKQHVASLFAGLSFVAMPTVISADEATAPAPAPAPSALKVEDCSKELLLAYFPQEFVNQTLKKFNVPQDKWATITKSLNEKDKEVLKIVEEKASKLDPNPLKDPQQRHMAVKIFRETLLQLFSDVMKANDISDEKQIQSMLDDVQQQKAKRFAQCMKEHRGPVPTPGPNANKSSSGDEDEDSED
jgi:hypothetical protein